jgi:hypothetical protein
MKMTDQYEWWRNALNGVRGPIHEGEPMPGFYEYRYKQKRDGEVVRIALAYWQQDGRLYCRYGDKILDDLVAREKWPFAAKRPISKDVYFTRIKTGRWPDEVPPASAAGDAPESARLSNEGPPVDSLEAISERVADLARSAEQIIAKGAAKTEVEADQAANLKKLLGDLEKKADEVRKREKQPHTDAAKAVDDAWNPIVKKAGASKTSLATVVITPYLTAQREAAKNAEAMAIVAGTPEPPPAPRTVGTLASVALRTVKSARIVDYDKALALFRGQPEGPRTNPVTRKRPRPSGDRGGRLRNH